MGLQWDHAVALLALLVLPGVYSGAPLTQVMLRTLVPAQANGTNYSRFSIGTPLGIPYETRATDMWQGWSLVMDWAHNTNGGITAQGTTLPVELVIPVFQSSADEALLPLYADFLTVQLGMQIVLTPSTVNTTLAMANRVVNQGVMVSSSVDMIPNQLDQINNGSAKIFSFGAKTGLQVPSIMQMTSLIRSWASSILIYILRENNEASMSQCEMVPAIAVGQMGMADANVLPIIMPSTFPGDKNYTFLQPLLRQQVDLLINCDGSDLTASWALISWLMTNDVVIKVIGLPNAAVPATEKQFAPPLDGVLSYFVDARVAPDPTLSVSDLDVQPWTAGVLSTALSNQYGRTSGVERDFNALAATFYAVTLANTFTETATIKSTLASAGTVASPAWNLFNGKVIFDRAGCVNYFMETIGYFTFPTDRTEKIYIFFPEVVAQVFFTENQRWAFVKCMTQGPSNYGMQTSTVGSMCEMCPVGQYSTYNADAGQRVCQDCAVGEEQLTQTVKNIQLNFCSRCAIGFFASSNGTGSCSSCSPGSFQNQTGQSTCVLCQAGTAAFLEASTECLKCQPLEDGTPTFSEKNGTSTCKACPYGGLCLPNNLTGLYDNYTNADGFYHLVTNITAHNGTVIGLNKSLWPCHHGLNGSACLSAGRCYAINGTEAMLGKFCGRCAPGFSRVLKDELCSKCMSLGSAAGLCALQVILILVMGTLVVFAVDQYSPSGYPWLSVEIWKLVFNYSTIMSLVYKVVSLNFGFTDFILSDALNWIGWIVVMEPAPLIQRAQFCMLEKLAPSLSVYESWTVLGLFITPLILIVDYFYVKIWNAAKGCMQRCFGLRVPDEMFTSLAIVHCFMLHSMVLRLVLVIFQCAQFDQLRLLWDPNLVCTSFRSESFRVFSIISLAVWCGGVPLFFDAKLRMFRRDNKLDKLKIVRTWGFLYNGFHPKCYYFEIWYMYRKVLYVVILLIDPLQPAVPPAYGAAVMWMIGIGLIAMQINHTYRPYDLRRYKFLQRIEDALHWAVLVTLGAQYMLWTMDTIFKVPSSIRNKGCFGVALLGNVIFLLFVLMGIAFIWIERSGWWQRNYESYVMITKTGIDFQIQNSMGVTLIERTFRELSLAELEVESTFRYSRLSEMLQRCLITALYWQRMGALHGSGLERKKTLFRKDAGLAQEELGEDSAAAALHKAREDVKRAKALLPTFAGDQITIEELYSASLFLVNDALKKVNKEAEKDDNQEGRDVPTTVAAVSSTKFFLEQQPRRENLNEEDKAMGHHNSNTAPSGRLGEDQVVQLAARGYCSTCDQVEEVFREIAENPGEGVASTLAVEDPDQKTLAKQKELLTKLEKNLQQASKRIFESVDNQTFLVHQKVLSKAAKGCIKHLQETIEKGQKDCAQLLISRAAREAEHKVMGRLLEGLKDREQGEEKVKAFAGHPRFDRLQTYAKGRILQEQCAALQKLKESLQEEVQSQRRELDLMLLQTQALDTVRTAESPRVDEAALLGTPRTKVVRVAPSPRY